MKKLILFAVLCSSCSVALPEPVTNTGAPRRSPGIRVENSCLNPPNALHGAQLASCKDFPDLGFCCGYAKAVVLEEQILSCAYMLCCNNEVKEFELSFAMCLPAEAIGSETKHDSKDNHGLSL